MRLIDADDFKKFIEKLTELGAPYDEIIKLLDRQPTVEIPSFNKLQDGTLIIETDLHPKVGRVFVEHKGFGTFFYSDGYEKRKKGEWKQHIYRERFVGYTEECEPLYKDIVVYICPFCGKEIDEHMENYCPNCGAEMEVE